MIIMQYTITLPADYDMGVIRRRVATRGPGFDDFPGLGVKVFTIREKGRFGAESNQYAPIYLWPAVEPMWGFVAGDGFKGIVDSFGWTSIRCWLGLAFARRDGLDWKAIRSVSREEEVIAPATNLSEMRVREIERARDAVRSPGLATRAVGVDVKDWTLARVDYWTEPQTPDRGGQPSFEALHVSAANASALAET